MAAVKAAGLTETLKGPGPLTMSAPTDEAFAKLESLRRTENRPPITLCADVVKLHSSKTVEGRDIAIKTMSGWVLVENAQGMTTGIGTSNGVIHVSDSVLLPK